MGFNVMGCEGRKELDLFEARKKTRKLRQFLNYNKTSGIKKYPNSVSLVKSKSSRNNIRICTFSSSFSKLFTKVKKHLFTI